MLSLPSRFFQATKRVMINVAAKLQQVPGNVRLLHGAQTDKNPFNSGIRLTEGDYTYA
jgi:hypothetical protein